MSTHTNRVPRIPLRPGVEIPQLGFGVFQIPQKDTEEIVARALDAGYRHIDTAAAYRNEEAVGQAIRASGIDREEIFLTTKCWNNDQGYDKAMEACRQSLARLGLEQIDLYLIHWPAPAHDLYVETWRAFIDLQSAGLVRTIGVSNFQPAHLDRLIAETGVTPSINQVELHPYFQQASLRRDHERLGIITEAWSPLGQGLELKDQIIGEIAATHSKTPAQVVLRWRIQLGNVVIPKSVTLERIVENFDVFHFQLGEEEMQAMRALEAGRRIGPDPDTFVRP
jgi:diketogulonate reductase-like aldo/keto reductase